jgi:hypothetical protein
MSESIDAVQKKLDDVLSRLKASKDPHLRRTLLLEMRLLMAELDRIVLESTRSYTARPRTQTPLLISKVVRLKTQVFFIGTPFLCWILRDISNHRADATSISDRSLFVRLFVPPETPPNPDGELSEKECDRLREETISLR